MFKHFFTGSLLCLLLIFKGSAQVSNTTTSSKTLIQVPYRDKLSWQWLHLMQSATYYRVAKEGSVDFNNCLLYASRMLGLSRLSVLGEGIIDPKNGEHYRWVDDEDPSIGMQQLSQAKGREHLLVLLLLGAYYGFQPQSSLQIDSIHYFLQQALQESKVLKEEKLERQALCLLEKMYLEINESKKADSVFLLVLHKSQTAGDKPTEAKALLYRALFPDFDPATTSGRIAYFEQAANLYQQVNNVEGRIYALTDAGYMSLTVFQLQKAHDLFLKAYHIAASIKYPYNHYNTDALALVTGLEGKFGEPLKYSIETIQTAERTKDSLGWAYFYSRLGLLYGMEEHREEESLKWLFKSLDRFILANDASLYLNLFNIVNRMYALGKGQYALDLVSGLIKKIPPKLPQDIIYKNLALARCYQSLKQFELAEQYTMEAEDIQKQYPMLRSLNQKSMINLLFGEIYYESKQLKQAQQYLDAYLADPRRESYLGNDLDAYSILIAIDSLKGNLTSALQRYRYYTKLLDSNFKVSRIRQAEELQVMYQTEEKENQIALLNEKAKLEQSYLNQTKLEKNVTIGGIIIVLFIAALLYRQSWHRKKINKVVTSKNEQLQRLVTEKEWLLKEIHHRVKNNLQVVMSLLNSQTAYIDNEPALTAIHDSQHRVHAMSLIHQKLYNSDNLSSIDMSVYIREMVSYLTDSFNTGQRIRMEYAIEPIQMDVSQAVPLGLILNEAITNALKYAFPGNRNGIITISLSQTDSSHCLLVISDNGTGIPPDVSLQKNGSLGMSLMRGLSEDLEGAFTIENQKGTLITVSFVYVRDPRKHAFTSTSFASGN